MNPHQQRLENLQKVLDYAHQKQWTIDTPEIKEKLKRSMGSFALEPATIEGYVATICNVLSWEKREKKTASFRNGGLIT